MYIFGYASFLRYQGKCQQQAITVNMGMLEMKVSGNCADTGGGESEYKNIL